MLLFLFDFSNLKSISYEYKIKFNVTYYVAENIYCKIIIIEESSNVLV
jgi:hypothetical protein